MSDKEILNKIRSTILDILPDTRIFLFGSRSKGVQSKSSDSDLLIITKADFSGKEKIRYSSMIDKALIKSIHAPVDILLDSEKEVNIKRNLPGHIIKTALSEGISL